LNKGNQQQRQLYEAKYKEKYGADTDLYTSPFDPELLKLHILNLYMSILLRSTLMKIWP
jgi:hypothetical protein